MYNQVKDLLELSPLQYFESELNITEVSAQVFFVGWDKSTITSRTLRYEDSRVPSTYTRIIG